MFKFSILTVFFQIHKSTSQSQAKQRFRFTKNNLCGVINILSLNVPELEHNLKQNANLSTSVLQNIQGCHEGCCVFTTKTPGLLPSTFWSGFQRQLYLLWQVKTLLISISSEATSMIADMPAAVIQQARVWQHRWETDRKWNKRHTAPVLQPKANIRFHIFPPPGWPSASNNLTTTRYFPGLLTRVMNLVNMDISQYLSETVAIILWDRNGVECCFLNWCTCSMLM